MAGGVRPGEVGLVEARCGRYGLIIEQEVAIGH
jgi:hypothetical protein